MKAQHFANSRTASQEVRALVDFCWWQLIDSDRGCTYSTTTEEKAAKRRYTSNQGKIQ